MENKENIKLTKKELKKMRLKATQSNPYYVAALIILFWPAGLYYMWKNSVFKLSARIMVTVVIAMLVLLIIMSRISNPSNIQ